MVTFTTDYGIDSDGPYYDTGGAVSGEEAALVWDVADNTYALVAYNP